MTHSVVNASLQINSVIRVYIQQQQTIGQQHFAENMHMQISYVKHICICTDLHSHMKLLILSTISQ